jgi:cobalamin biosynthesis protein CobT
VTRMLSYCKIIPEGAIQITFCSAQVGKKLLQDSGIGVTPHKQAKEDDDEEEKDEDQTDESDVDIFDATTEEEEDSENVNILDSSEEDDEAEDVYVTDSEPDGNDFVLQSELDDFLLRHGVKVDTKIQDGLVIKFFEHLRYDLCYTYEEFFSAVENLQFHLEMGYDADFGPDTNIDQYICYCKKLYKKTPERFNSAIRDYDAEWYSFWYGIFWV